ncbi:hypothetical protein DAPPUDRAFT_316607 [Daphnia pulex]|uniref:Uncharacterized protein n=1 Tax=Daphnia pulex TaxID=6669 RepID=E9GDF7_DAPPU|nr:hypothetical protein DAPPUDRAFT_316607 [Daphnia pulex]|eukprot:EFX82487.1 hypothetical protein DAPPUDRAFT_316607 [Daphnia pulex]
MKLSIAILICCAMIGSIQSQGTGGNRPSIIQALFAPFGQFLSIFRRPSRPSVSAAAAASSGNIDASSIFTDPQVLQESLNSINQGSQQQIQAEPVVQTQIVTETLTVFSTIPSLERVTSVETMVEMMTETLTETVKTTLTKTEHITMTHSTCSSSVAASKAPAASSKVAEKVSPSAVSTSTAVQPTKKARLTPYVVKRAVEIEASSSL